MVTCVQFQEPTFQRKKKRQLLRMVGGLHLESRHWGVEGRRFPRLLSQPSLVARLQANKRLCQAPGQQETHLKGTQDGTWDHPLNYTGTHIHVHLQTHMETNTHTHTDTYIKEQNKNIILTDVVLHGLCSSNLLLVLRIEREFMYTHIPPARGPSRVGVI